jgi:hypothetical protein
VAAEIRHLFGPLIHKQDDQLNIGMVPQDGRADVLEEGRLARLGRRDDQPPLTTPDRAEQIHQTAGRGTAGVLQRQPRLRIDRGQVFKRAVHDGVKRAADIQPRDARERPALRLAPPTATPTTPATPALRPLAAMLAVRGSAPSTTAASSTTAPTARSSRSTWSTTPATPTAATPAATTPPAPAPCLLST